MRRAMAFVIAALVVLVGCGSDPELRASCGPVTFSEFPASLAEFPPLDDDAAAALTELVTGESGIEAAGMDEEFDWSIASREDDQLLLFGRAVGPDGPYGGYARFTRVADRWMPRGWGGCRVEVAAAGYGSASVALDPNRPIDPASTAVPLLIKERECASGRAPVDREVVPVVTETDASVTVVVLVEPDRGDVDCPDNPWHAITVTLDSPLGDRAIFDGNGESPIPVGLPDGDP